MLKNNRKLIFSDDPFREEAHGEEIFKTSQYVLNISPGSVFRCPDNPNKEENHRKITITNETEERTLKSVLKDAARQIVASLIILAVGFIALNWSAYYQIAKSKWEEMTGISTTSEELNKIADTSEAQNTVTKLETSNNITVQKKQIPALNLEVAPMDTRLIIPRINQNIPIVGVSSQNLIDHDWEALEKDMQEALRECVIHYLGTSTPGQH